MDVYLDHSATTQPFSAVCDRMDAWMRSGWGNPSSKHTLGVRAEEMITEARDALLRTLPGADGTVLFTSGGTEADNLAILGSLFHRLKRTPKIITTAVEHPAVTEPFRFLESLGAKAVFLPVDARGRADLNRLEAELDESTALVSMMQVNNEVGAIEPIAEAAGLIRRKAPGCLFHVDGVQGYGKLIPPMRAIDLYTISSHKLNGPKGVGALYVRKGVTLRPILHGGHQESGLRSGTENTAGIGGFGLAAEITARERAVHTAHLATLRNLLWDLLAEIGAVFHSGRDASAAPHIVNASLPGVPAEVLLHALEARGVYVSTGSACSSNRPELSPTLTAMGVPREQIKSAVRFSLGYGLDETQIRYAAQCVAEEAERLRL